ncbi:MAG: twin-arginine translocase subunit TatC [Rickettsiales bacterium]|jgi:sec-independent protein translocase protein TatC|nr:twin-arginine translocase subunit TatC [Rickettsiales bacterium]
MQKMTLMQHFRELKRRVVWSLAFFCAAFAMGLFVADALQSIITAPLFDVWAEPTMIYTGIADGLAIQFSLAGLFALFISAPFVLYQVWRYVSPALKRDEKKIAVAVLLASPILFLSGASFAYFILLPIMFAFFLQIAPETAAMMPNVKTYLVFSLDLLKAFGLAFQFPLILILLNRTGVLSKKQLASMGRYFIVGIFIVAAVLTPPDIVSQIALALPLVVLFGLSFLFMV